MVDLDRVWSEADCGIVCAEREREERGPQRNERADAERSEKRRAFRKAFSHRPDILFASLALTHAYRNQITHSLTNIATHYLPWLVLALGPCAVGVHSSCCIRLPVRGGPCRVTGDAPPPPPPPPPACRPSLRACISAFISRVRWSDLRARTMSFSIRSSASWMGWEGGEGGGSGGW